MMNYIWSFMIIFSIIYAIIFNKLDLITLAIFDSTKQAVNLSITMLGIITLWSGIMNIVSNTNIIKYLSKTVSPVITKIFHSVNKSSKAYEYICLNFTSNLLGLGNASTPLGLKAVKSLENENDSQNNILKLILINTASIQLIPSTIIGLRSMLGSNKPNEIIIYVWICSIFSVIVALFSYMLLSRSEK